jgi:hypothetical protein
MLEVEKAVQFQRNNHYLNLKYKNYYE